MFGGGLGHDGGSGEAYLPVMVGYALDHRTGGGGGGGGMAHHLSGGDMFGHAGGGGGGGGGGGHLAAGFAGFQQAVPTSPTLLLTSLASMGSPQALDEVRTVFISGLPNDVKEREVNNMLRYLPGYEACQINWKSGQPQAFALFTSNLLARSAVEQVHNVQFDDTVFIRAEMARKNLFSKEGDPTIKRVNTRPPSVAVPAPLVSPTPLMSPASATTPLGMGMGMNVGMGMGGGGLLGGSPLGPHGQMMGAMVGMPGMLPGSSGPGLLPMAPMRAAAYSPVSNLRDNLPCNTLFIGNLGDNVSEMELRGLFAMQPGYRQMKVVRGPKATTAFVEFADLASAMLAQQTIQGAVLPSSDRGGIRVQYSKQPFGQRDVSPVPGLAHPGNGTTSSSQQLGGAAGGLSMPMDPAALVGSIGNMSLGGIDG